MPYPNSSEVSDGMPTSFQQYNRLRKDALFLGQAETDAAPAGLLLARYMEGLQLQALDTDRVRIPASGTAPVGLVIGGCPLQAVANVDLPLGSRPSGSAAEYFVFAVRSVGSTTFTLDTNTSATETSTTRLVGRFYWDGDKIIPESVRSEPIETLRGLLALGQGLPAEGRLTLSPGAPLTTMDVTSSDTVYYSPYTGNRLALYHLGWGWVVHEYEELAIPLAGKGTFSNVDIFLYWDNNEVKYELLVWAAGNARGSALGSQDGVLVKATEPTKRYIGTVRTYAAGLTCDTQLRRYVWNYYNREPRKLLRKVTASAWTDAVATWHVPNGEEGQVEIVVGDGSGFVDLALTVGVKCGNGEYASIGIGDNDTSGVTLADQVGTGIGGAETSANVGLRATAILRGHPTAGVHVYYWLEKVLTGIVNFFGTGDVTMGDSGLIGMVWG